MIWHIFLTCDCSVGDGAIHLPSLGEVSPILWKIPYKFCWDCHHSFRWTVLKYHSTNVYTSSYIRYRTVRINLTQVATPKVFGRATDPWKLRQVRWSCILPKQWGDASRSSEQCPYLPPGPWLARGEVHSFGWGGSTSPFHHVVPQYARGTWFLVGDRGHVKVPRQETILMAHKYPG